MMKRIFSFSNIRLVLILFVFGFIYSFATQRNLDRTIKDRKVAFVGSEFLFITHDSVNKLLIENTNKSKKLKKDALDLKKLEHSISNHPYVDQCEIHVTLDGVLHAMVSQKQPIARVFNSGDVYYIDYEGVKMPLSNQYSARVPVFYGNMNAHHQEKLLSVMQSIHDDPYLKMNITGVELTQRGGLILKNRGFDFVIDFGKPVNVERKFSNYKAFMQKAVQDSLVFQYKKINLRFTQQVVCTK